MKTFKLYIKRIKGIIIVGILIIIGCEDNIQKWELQVNTLPNETGLVVHHISDTHIDTLNNSQYFDDGAELFIEAHPIAGWTFDHWRGDIEHSTNPTILLKDDHKSITAVFNKVQYSISTTISGQGEVLEEVVFGKTTNYDYGTNIKLTAIPETGWAFDRWNGDLSGSENPATFILDDNKSITAVFNKVQYSISTTISGQGEVLEEVVLGKTTNYDYGTNIKLTAIPETGWAFDRWNGDLSGSENPTTFILDDNKHITAVFKSNVFGSDSTFTIIAMGQSNMVGVGTDGGDLFIDTRVKVWNDAVNEWILADPSKSLVTETLFINYHTNHNNLAFHFAKQIAEVYDVEVRILILAKSGINIGQYITIGNESTYYDTLRNSLNASEINEVDCILWHQGESNNYGAANSYADSLQIVIDRLRSEPEIELTTPFIAGELIEGTSRDTRNDVYFNLEWYIEDNYVVVAKLHDLPGIDDDIVHFNGSSLVIAGRERYFESFKLMITD